MGLTLTILATAIPASQVLDISTSTSMYCIVRDRSVDNLSDDAQCPAGSGAIKCRNGWMHLEQPRLLGVKIYLRAHITCVTNRQLYCIAGHISGKS